MKDQWRAPDEMGSCGRSQGICTISDLQMLKDIWRHFTTDVSYFRPYAETKKNRGEWKSGWNGFNLCLGSDQVLLKSQVLLSQSVLPVLVFF